MISRRFPRAGAAGERLDERELGVAEHAHEDVVEVVGDAAGQHPQALQLLALLELALQLRRSSSARVRSVMSRTNAQLYSCPLNSR